MSSLTGRAQVRRALGVAALAAALLLPSGGPGSVAAAAPREQDKICFPPDTKVAQPGRYVEVDACIETDNGRFLRTSGSGRCFSDVAFGNRYEKCVLDISAWTLKRDGAVVADQWLNGSNHYPGPGTYELVLDIHARGVTMYEGGSKAEMLVDGTIAQTVTFTTPANYARVQAGLGRSETKNVAELRIVNNGPEPTGELDFKAFNFSARLGDLGYREADEAMSGYRNARDTPSEVTGNPFSPSRADQAESRKEADQLPANQVKQTTDPRCDSNFALTICSFASLAPGESTTVRFAAEHIRNSLWNLNASGLVEPMADGVRNDVYEEEKPAS